MSAKRILVLSDTHGELTGALAAARREQPDYIFHLGDHSSDAVRLSDAVRARVFGVRGNCDFHSDFPGSQTVQIGGHRFLLCHGHQYGVKFSTDRLCYAAEEERASAALFGHTHVPCLQYNGGLLLLNPGSISQPRSGQATYGVIVVEEGGLHPDIVAL